MTGPIDSAPLGPVGSRGWGGVLEEESQDEGEQGVGARVHQLPLAMALMRFRARFSAATGLFSRSALLRSELKAAWAVPEMSPSYTVSLPRRALTWAVISGRTPSG